MAIKPPDLLNRLPSVAELLEKPPIRALADRWNRSVVAGGVRSFLDELRSDFERRAADLPSIRELAERAARFVVSRQHHSLGVAINATGRICGSPWTSTPLAEAALERMIALGREYATDPGTDAGDIADRTAIVTLSPYRFASRRRGPQLLGRDLAGARGPRSRSRSARRPGRSGRCRRRRLAAQTGGRRARCCSRKSARPIAPRPPTTKRPFRPRRRHPEAQQRFVPRRRRNGRCRTR